MSMTEEQRRQKSKECWERQQALFDSHAANWESFRRLVSPLFAARLAERGDKPLTRCPPWCLRLPAEGEPPAFLVARPVYKSGPGKRGHVAPDHLVIELMVARIRTRTTTTKDPRDLGGWELSASLEPGKARVSGLNLTFGDEAVRRAVAVATSFVADPSAALSRSSDNCCLCGRGLTDELSRSRGVGPECVRLLNALVGTYSTRKVQRVFAAWEREAVEEPTA